MNQILQEDLNIINVGLKGFEQDMEKQGAAVCQVDWKPVETARYWMHLIE